MLSNNLIAELVNDPLIQVIVLLLMMLILLLLLLLCVVLVNKSSSKFVHLGPKLS